MDKRKCSFCGRNLKQINGYLAAGQEPGVFICKECVERINEENSPGINHRHEEKRSKHPTSFTERARMVINYANEEAMRMKHSQIDTEHLLLGLIREGEGIAARVLQDLGINLKRLETEVNNIIEKSHVPTNDQERLPLVFTRAANQILQYSMEEAQKLDFLHVGTEHILIGLIREKYGIAARTLGSFDITLEKVRKVLKPIITEPSDEE